MQSIKERAAIMRDRMIKCVEFVQGLDLVDETRQSILERATLIRQGITLMSGLDLLSQGRSMSPEDDEQLILVASDYIAIIQIKLELGELK